ncbi:MAG: LysR family transcriptional regulator [Solobacterium sp.]|nr:LysR family transcriptional regulator [Solobacterium sp.]
MIKLNELQFFMKVAELQNMTRAAEVLHVSQPSLSRSIRALEEDLGYSLFDRRGKNSIVLNDYGQIVYKWGQSVFSDLNEMTKELDKHDVEKEDAVNFAF